MPLVDGPVDDGIGSGMGAVRQCGVLKSQGCDADPILSIRVLQIWVLEHEYGASSDPSLWSDEVERRLRRTALSCSAAAARARRSSTLELPPLRRSCQVRFEPRAG